MNSDNVMMVVLCNLLILALIPTHILADENRLARLKSDVEYLCSPKLEGRNVPGKGGDLTSKWLGDTFRDIGLTPGASATSFFQEFQLLQSKIDTSITTLTLYLPDRKVTLKWGTQFLLFPRKIANYESELDVAYAHYGIKSDDLKRDDFGDKTNGKAALVLNGSGDLPPQRAGRHGMTPFKAAAARRAGAELMAVLYTEDGDTWPPKSLQRKISDSEFPLTDLPNSKQEFLTVHINSIPSEGHKNVGSNLNEDIFKLLAADSDNEKVRLHLNLVFKKPDIHVGRNVIGQIAGETDKYILFGAHYDHLGVQGISDEGNIIYYPGADDNASGVSVILEISRLWKSREQPKYGLIIVAFGAEEDGMLGSSYFADNLPSHKDKFLGMINLDMIGGNGFASMRKLRQKNSVPDPDYTALYYSAASPDILNVAIGTGINAGLNIDFKAIGRFPFSDAGSFNSIGIPTISIFGGFHSGYSELNDTPEFINWNKLVKMVLLTDNLIINFNKLDSNIIFDQSLKTKSSKMRY